jgi:hypothetical protein
LEGYTGLKIALDITHRPVSFERGFYLVPSPGRGGDVVLTATVLEQLGRCSRTAQRQEFGVNLGKL